MKKLFTVALILLLCATAIAEGMTPAMFIGSRGFVVLDENRINSMNSANSDSEAFSGRNFNGLRICLYSMKTDTSSETIMFTDNDVYYIAVDMMGMFSGGESTGNAMLQTYIDLCNAFDFDVYAVTSGPETLLMYGDIDALTEAMKASGAPQNTKIPETEDSKETFLEKLAEFK